MSSTKSHDHRYRQQMLKNRPATSREMSLGQECPEKIKGICCDLKDSL